MLATRARMVPDMASAWLELPSGLKTSCSPSFFTSTFGSAERAMLPSGPFTEILPPARFTSTPFGSGTGYFAIRDMADSIGCGCEASLGYDAEEDRKSTRLNSSHSQISYAVFCLKKKK